MIVTAAIGCGGNDDAKGELNGACFPNGTCNDGLACVAGVCKSLTLDASVPDMSLGDAPRDAPGDAPVCTTALEPNETIQAATVTGVASTQTARTYTGLMICPAGDKDHFAVNIVTANTNLEMLIDFDPTLSIGQGSILNSGGVPLANAAQVSGMPNRLRAYTPNLPTGTYYVVVYAGTNMISSYQLTLTVTGP
jgi:hypothetical protein